MEFDSNLTFILNMSFDDFLKTYKFTVREIPTGFPLARLEITIVELNRTFAFPRWSHLSYFTNEFYRRGVLLQIWNKLENETV